MIFNWKKSDYKSATIFLNEELKELIGNPEKVTVGITDDLKYIAIKPDINGIPLLYSQEPVFYMIDLGLPDGRDKWKVINVENNTLIIKREELN